MNPNVPETRERPEPVEGAEPVPVFVWISIIGLVVWGFAYFLLYSGDPSEVGGDMRSPVAPPSEAPAGGAVVSGETVYNTRCAACHQATGAGVTGAFPPLAGSPWPTARAELPVRIVLNGLQGPIEVLGVTYQGVMPAFAAQLSDAEIAAALTYVRSSFGNQAPPITAEEVAKERAATADRAGAWTVAELGTP